MARMPCIIFGLDFQAWEFVVVGGMMVYNVMLNIV